MSSDKDVQQAVFSRIFEAPGEWKQLETIEEREAARDFMRWIIENRKQESNITFHSSPAHGVTRAQISGYKNYHLKN